jgi:hypothetical protein
VTYPAVFPDGDLTIALVSRARLRGADSRPPPLEIASILMTRAIPGHVSANHRIAAALQLGVRDRNVKGYQMPAAESRRSTKTPHWIIAVEPAGYSGRR